MAKVPYFILLTFSLPFSVVAQQLNASVSAGASLTATDDIIPWRSPSGDFAFGFQRIPGLDTFVLSIWYEKIPEKTIIWYPQRNPTVPRGSKVELTNVSGLILSDPQGKQLWTSASMSDVSFGVMNDTGNFVLLNSSSHNIWESFNFPADTMLPNQVISRGGVVNSKTSETDFTRGRFQLRLLVDGNLVLNSRAVPSNYAYEPYYATTTNDSSNPQNSGEQLVFDAKGNLYISRRNGQRFDLSSIDALPSGDYYHRATLDVDGVFTQYYRLKSSTGNTSWQVLWFEPENICKSGGVEGSGACGFNNVCGLVDGRPKCECPQWFSLLNDSDPSGDCKPNLNFTLGCDEEDDSNDGQDLFDFMEFTDIDWPSADYVHMMPTNEQNCKQSCMEDCFCAVAIYGGNECWKKKIPLSFGRKDNSVNKKAFLKFRKGDRPLQSPAPPSAGKQKGRRVLVVMGSLLLSTSVLVNIVLMGVICVGFFLVYKKNRNVHPSSKSVETNLHRFTYRQLLEATNGFSEELGKGSFGIVYKGMLGTNTVAVKKLDRVFEDGEKEFKTEVNAIAKTHHKNLVQLLGYCDDGEQRLLVYEYMSNGTLAEYLFGDVKPSWEQRSWIAVGIAKGLSYLHEGCRTQIIHCDIKPKNILLDDYYEAKIADFGLAKLLMMDQSRTSTGIRGTKGYVAPEWFRNTAVTAKVDVYSFGVLLLEIVSCRKSLNFESGNEDMAVLSDWAWDCYLHGRLDAFVGNDPEAMDEYERLTRFVRVGLWCVQENPSLRPTMRTVIQMLEGAVQVTEPPCD